MPQRYHKKVEKESNRMAFGDVFFMLRIGILDCTFCCRRTVMSTPL